MVADSCEIVDSPLDKARVMSYLQSVIDSKELAINQTETRLKELKSELDKARLRLIEEKE